MSSGPETPTGTSAERVEAILPAPSTLAHPAYVWWPETRPDSVEVIFTHHVRYLVAGDLALLAVLCLPWVVAVTGVPEWVSATVILPHIAWVAFVRKVLQPRIRTATWPFHVAYLGNVLWGLGSAHVLIAAGGDPRTPLWMFPVAYAAINGTMAEFRPTISLLLGHMLSPLATIPFTWAAGPAWSVGAAVLASVTSGCLYHLLALYAAQWRDLRRERDEALARVREREGELARHHLARDLHDSVGSALSLVALYGDLVERHAENPPELRRVATLVRASAREGLGELRAVLAAVAPPGESVGALAENLRALVQRAADAAGITIDLALDGDGTVTLEPSVRLALVRVCQESLNNALKHGQPRHVGIRLGVRDGIASLEVKDDGRGFVQGRTGVASRGLANMRARALELGGTVDIEASPGQGTHVALRLPLAGPGASPPLH